MLKSIQQSAEVSEAWEPLPLDPGVAMGREREPLDVDGSKLRRMMNGELRELLRRTRASMDRLSTLEVEILAEMERRAIEGKRLG